MLYLFDMDDTLCEGYMGPPRKPYDRMVLLPGRREKMQKLLEAGHKVGIVTNQGGIAFGYNTEKQFFDKCRMMIYELGLPPNTAVAVCFSDSRSNDERYNTPEECARRKPSGAMIRELMNGLNEDQAMYIGDRQEDKDAAENAGVPFQWANEFFVKERDPRIDQIYERLKAVSPGKWEVVARGFNDEYDVECATIPNYTIRGMFDSREKAEFFANAPDDILYLLTVLESR